MRSFLFQILEARGDTAPRMARIVSALLMGLIALSVLAIVLGTVPAINARFGRALAIFEYFCLTIFSIEYLLRLWVCTSHPQYSGPIRGRLRFALSPMAIIDLLAILPGLFMGVSDSMLVRAFRLLRMIRLVKLVRYMEALRLLGNVAIRVRYDMAVTGMLAGLLLLVGSTLMYMVEHEVQPEAFSSIPATMWWGVTTLTTVGYGDTYPVTALGRFLGAIVAVLGVALFALPTGILGAAYIEELRNNREKNETPSCSHCGQPAENPNTLKVGD